jgi:hypothetical protein
VRFELAAEQHIGGAAEFGVDKWKELVERTGLAAA